MVFCFTKHPLLHRLYNLNPNSVAPLTIIFLFTFLNFKYLYPPNRLLPFKTTIKNSKQVLNRNFPFQIRLPIEKLQYKNRNLLSLNRVFLFSLFSSIRNNPSPTNRKSQSSRIQTTSSFKQYIKTNLN